MAEEAIVEAEVVMLTLVLACYATGAAVNAVNSWALYPTGSFAPPPAWTHIVDGIAWPIVLACDVWERLVER